MWAPYEPPEIGEPMETLVEAGNFVLVGVSVREGVATEHGPRDAADLRVATTDRTVTRLFSTFWAGIVGQCKRIGDGDLPAVCRVGAELPPRANGRRGTRELELVERLAAGADVAAIAKAQDVPMMPTGGPASQGDDVGF